MNDSNFSVLDRLMEFGLSMGIAQQMISTMNQTMQAMQIPETAKPVPPKLTEWYAAIDGKATGPFSEQEMKNLLLERKVTKESLVWCAGMLDWQTAEHTPGLLKLLLQLPPSL